MRGISSPQPISLTTTLLLPYLFVLCGCCTVTSAGFLLLFLSRLSFCHRDSGVPFLQSHRISFEMQLELEMEACLRHWLHLIFREIPTHCKWESQKESWGFERSKKLWGCKRENVGRVDGNLLKIEMGRSTRAHPLRWAGKHTQTD